ncbi:MAG: hypothetical protein KDA63_12445 [Planctomycetales bacterium]|nr:hypothetical protein [Planctomycetales bacterium]
MNAEIEPQPEDDLTQPANITHWETSEDNLFEAKIVVVELRHFHDTMATNELAKVPIEVWGALETGIQPEQQQAIDQLVENQDEIFEHVREAIYQDYTSDYDALKEVWELGAKMYSADDIDTNKYVPEVKVGNEIDHLVTFISISIGRFKDGVAPMGIAADAAWTANGIGVLLRDGKVIEVGTGYVGIPDQ